MRECRLLGLALRLVYHSFMAQRDCTGADATLQVRMVSGNHRYTKLAAYGPTAHEQRVLPQRLRVRAEHKPQSPSPAPSFLVNGEDGENLGGIGHLRPRREADWRIYQKTDGVRGSYCARFMLYTFGRQICTQGFVMCV